MAKSTKPRSVRGVRSLGKPLPPTLERQIGRYREIQPSTEETPTKGNSPETSA